MEQDGVIREQTAIQEVSIKQGKGVAYFNSYTIFNCPEGKYRLRPLWRKIGETKWRYCKEAGGGEFASDWDVLVKAENETPDFYLKYVHEPNNLHSGGIYTYGKLGEDWQIGLVISNPKRMAIKGRIKVMWERIFSSTRGNSFYTETYSTEREQLVNFVEINREIGGIELDIPAGYNGIQTFPTCRFPDDVKPIWNKVLGKENEAQRDTPILLFYFQEEGTTDWKLIGVDTEAILSGDTWTVKNKAIAEPAEW